MKYITYKRFKEKSLSGLVNIPYGTEIERIDDILYYNSRPICLFNSEYGLQHFITNDDNTGLSRAQIILSINKKLKNNKDKWDCIWEDESLLRFKKKGLPDHWLWNSDFYSADAESLNYIYQKVK